MSSDGQIHNINSPDGWQEEAFHQGLVQESFPLVRAVILDINLSSPLELQTVIFQ